MRKKQTNVINPLPGKLVCVFSYEERGMFPNLHILYNEDNDNYQGASMMAVALYRLIKEYPSLLEQILFTCERIASENVKPFYDILNNEEKK